MKIYATLIEVKKSLLSLKRELAGVARRAAQDRLTVAASGNISARIGSRIYIKAKDTFFERAKPSDFVRLDIRGRLSKRDKARASHEYRLHIACYKKRPEVKAVFHTHPLFTTVFYSAGVRQKPLTLEFALYINGSIDAIDFLPPGTKELAAAIEKAIAGHDAVVMKKHGLLTVGRNLQQAYLKALIIERECRAQFICRLFKRPPPFLRKNEIYSIGAA